MKKNIRLDYACCEIEWFSVEKNANNTYRNLWVSSTKRKPRERQRKREGGRKCAGTWVGDGHWAERIMRYAELSSAHTLTHSHNTNINYHTEICCPDKHNRAKDERTRKKHTVKWTETLVRTHSIQCSRSTEVVMSVSLFSFSLSSPIHSFRLHERANIKYDTKSSHLGICAFFPRLLGHSTCGRNGFNIYVCVQWHVGVQREKLSQCVYFGIGYNRSLTTLTNTLFYRFLLRFFPTAAAAAFWYCCHTVYSKQMKLTLERIATKCDRLKKSRSSWTLVSLDPSEAVCRFCSHRTDVT